MFELSVIDCPGINCPGIGVVMREQIESYAARYATRIALSLQNVSADMDPDILQLPGGSVIATLLWLYAKGTTVLRKH
jgi:hypothetical protein